MAALSLLINAGCSLLGDLHGVTIEDQYSIYDAVIYNMNITDMGSPFPYKDSGPFKPDTVVIEDTTRLYSFYRNGTDKLYKYAKKEMPSLSLTLFEKFRKIENEERKIIPYFKVPYNVILVSRSDLEKVFDVPDGGWGSFYKKYPNSQGILHFSYVAIDKENGSALVYAGNQRHGLNGVGMLYLLKFMGKSWVVKERCTTWIS